MHPFIQWNLKFICIYALSAAFRFFVQQFVQADNNENAKPQYYGPFYEGNPPRNIRVLIQCKDVLLLVLVNPIVEITKFLRDFQYW